MRARRVKKLDPAEPLADNAARIIRVRLDELRSFASRALEADRIRDQHDMRIAAKRLRYVLEATEFCFGSSAPVARRRLLFDRFQAFWAEQERAGTWDRLERAMVRRLGDAHKRRRAAKRARKAQPEPEAAAREEPRPPSPGASAAQRRTARPVAEGETTPHGG